MTLNTPDRWVVVEFRELENEPVRKVLAGWYGGYGGSDSWKLSSGITEIKEHADCYEFSNVSGSVYRCNKRAYGMSGIMNENYQYWSAYLKSEELGSVEIVEDYEPTDL
ncbi:hypothetical protein [Methylomonas sp. YC3]